MNRNLKGMAVGLVMAAGLVATAMSPSKVVYADENESGHIHEMEIIGAAESSCQIAGHAAYYHCADCGKYYKDEAGTTETTPEDENLPLKEHSYEWVVVKEATAKEEGLEQQVCTECQETGESRPIEKLAHAHRMESIPACESTCITHGNHVFYHCVECNQFFKDEAGTIPTTLEGEKLPYGDHNYAWVVIKEPTQTEAGLETQMCVYCRHRGDTRRIPSLAPVQNNNDKKTTDNKSVKKNTAKNTDPTKDNPHASAKTGDNTNIFVWLVTMAACAGVTVMETVKKRNMN